ERAEDVVPPCACPLVAAVTALSDKARDDFDVAVHQCEIGVEVTPVQRIKSHPLQVRVPLRHSPYSRSPAASTASAWSRKSCCRITLPLLSKVASMAWSWVSEMPLLSPRATSLVSTRKRSPRSTNSRGSNRCSPQPLVHSAANSR